MTHEEKDDNRQPLLLQEEVADYHDHDHGHGHGSRSTTTNEIINIINRHDHQITKFSSSSSSSHHHHHQETKSSRLSLSIWIETKKLWHLVGPAIFQRIAMASMNVVTQAFAGHLGDVELASITIANTVICGFAFGFLLGMASALETLCGQAFGAKKYHMLGIYMQRSWIVLFLCSIFSLPLYIFATPIMKALGQPDDVAEQTGVLALWFIPLHVSFAFQFPVQRFLMSQLKSGVLAWVAVPVFGFHLVCSYLVSVRTGFGVVGLAVVLDVSWWLLFIGLFGYTALGGCPLTWTGFSMEAFIGLWDFFKLSLASGVMLCLENWYYRILLLMTGFLKDATVMVDALSICMNINSWELMIPFAFFAATGVRVANELGGGNGKAAKFAAIVSVIESTIIGMVFCVMILVLHDKFGLIFTSSPQVLIAADNLSYLLVFTILLNSVQPILSGVAVGSGWQSDVAYVNLACYYVIGLPIGIIMGWVLHWGVEGIWGGMIFGGTALQTIILAILTYRCDWENEAKKVAVKVENY